MPAAIRSISVDDLFAHHDAQALLAEYAAESAIDGLPTPTPDQERYRLIESSGALRVLAAFQGDTLMGFLALLVSVNPHYSAMLAVIESFFVGAAYRKTGAGLALLHQAEEVARQAHADGLLVSAPSGGRLAQVLPATGYRETNRVFFRGLA